MQLSESGNDFTQQRQVEEIIEKEQTIDPKADETKNFNESDSELDWVWNRQNKKQMQIWIHIEWLTLMEKAISEIKLA